MNELIAQIPRTERIEQHVELARWSSGNPLLVGGILVALGLYAIFFLYRREARGQVSVRLRFMLIACRACVLLLLGAIGLEPVVVQYVHRRLEGCTLVLADASASMSLADVYRAAENRHRVDAALGSNSENRPTRSRLVDSILNRDDGRWLTALAARNTVKLFSFSDSAVLDAQIGGTPASGTTSAPVHEWLRATGPVTDLTAALRSAVDQAAGYPLAGIVLLTDGGFNHGESLETAAAFLKQKGVPLHAVGIGDPSDPINVAVKEISTPRAVFKNDPFNVTVRLAAQGAGNRPLKVELLEKREDGAPQVVDTKTISLPSDGAIAPISFERKVTQPGRVSYLARLPLLDDETIAGDNERESVPAVRVADDKMRVLIVAGAPSYDYRYLARMLERDKSVDVSCWLQSADVKAVRDGTTQITELPATAEAILKYDAILLLDVDPAQLDPTWCGQVSSFVSDHGGGLLYQAGNKYAGKFLRGSTTSSLTELLPIVPDPDAEILINEMGPSQTRPWNLVLPESASGDPLLRLTDDPRENAALWSMLEGPYWHYPVRREKPVAQVLMRHSDPRMSGAYGQQVLFATQLVGSGRAAYLGFNSTWRWRRGDDRFFNRFWTQLIRFLVEGKVQGGASRVTIQLAQDEYEVGQAVVVTVRALDDHFAPMFLPQLDMEVSGGGAATDSAAPTMVHLVPQPGRDGYYQGRFIADRPGVARLTITLPGLTKEPPTQRDIAIVQPNLEMQNTAMNRTALRRLSSATGGQYLEIDEAAKLPDMIPDRSQTYVVRERPRMLWDNAYALSGIVLLLTIEWILRKKAKLL